IVPPRKSWPCNSSGCSAAQPFLSCAERGSRGRATMNLADLRTFVDARWDQDLIPRLVDYVKVPAKSPAFDASWLEHGYLQSVVQEAHAWAAAQKIAGLKLEIVSIEGRTPCIFFDVPATGGLGNARTVLFYGHLDKQPEMTGWRDDLGPWTPK